MNPLSHDALLFNVHDLVLLMAAGQYLLLAGLLLATRPRGDQSSLLLTALLLMTALQSLDTLLIWSDPLRLIVLDRQSNLLLLGGFSYWLQGPLLYAYVASVLYRSLPLRRWDLLHLLPALLAALLLAHQYYLQPPATRIALMSDMTLMWETPMRLLVTGWHLSVILYGIAGLWLLHRYRQQLRQHYANTEGRQRRWLTWVLLGFIVIASWKLAVHLWGNNATSGLPNVLGIISNYLQFVFVTSLVFFSIRYAQLFRGLNPGTADPGKQAIKPEQIQRVERYIREHKPYLEPDISLEILAQRLSLPERTLSRVLNQHFGKNFFEFINHHRIEQAKTLLRDETQRDQTITKIMLAAGFTSKSTFNTLFKKWVGQTPSQYRKAGN